jgi:hypothetical protein
LRVEYPNNERIVLIFRLSAVVISSYVGEVERTEFFWGLFKRFIAATRALKAGYGRGDERGFI